MTIITIEVTSVTIDLNWY